jgi:acylphosphatase
MVFLARITNGRLDFASELSLARFREWCKQNEGAALRIEQVKPIRTRSQNNFYWVYLGVISQETGHTVQELHQWAKKKFLPPKLVKVFGVETEMLPSTTELSKLEFGEFLERICAETGVALPDPQAAGYLPH